jgi:hypothetical protein
MQQLGRVERSLTLSVFMGVLGCILGELKMILQIVKNASWLVQLEMLQPIEDSATANNTEPPDLVPARFPRRRAPAQDPPKF